MSVTKAPQPSPREEPRKQHSLPITMRDLAVGKLVLSTLQNLKVSASSVDPSETALSKLPLSKKPSKEELTSSLTALKNGSDPIGRALYAEIERGMQGKSENKTDRLLTEALETIFQSKPGELDAAAVRFVEKGENLEQISPTVRAKLTQRFLLQDFRLQETSKQTVVSLLQESATGRKGDRISLKNRGAVDLPAHLKGMLSEQFCRDAGRIGSLKMEGRNGEKTIVFDQPEDLFILEHFLETGLIPEADFGRSRLQDSRHEELRLREGAGEEFKALFAEYKKNATRGAPEPKQDWTRISMKQEGSLPILARIGDLLSQTSLTDLTLQLQEHPTSKIYPNVGYEEEFMSKELPSDRSTAKALPEEEDWEAVENIPIEEDWQVVKNIPGHALHGGEQHVTLSRSREGLSIENSLIFQFNFMEDPEAGGTKYASVKVRIFIPGDELSGPYKDLENSKIRVDYLVSRMCETKEEAQEISRFIN